MAIRARAVRPDAVLETADGQQIPHVTDEAFYRAVMDAATVVALAGGEFRVVVQRAPTEFANESVTVAALVEWRNHASAKPQTEPHVTQQMVDVGEVGDLIESQEAYNAELEAAREERHADPDEDEVDAALPTAVH